MQQPAALRGQLLYWTVECFFCSSTQAGSNESKLPKLNAVVNLQPGSNGGRLPRLNVVFQFAIGS